MPEGPSIVILKESVEVLNLVGALVRHVEGNTSIEKDRMLNQQIRAVRSWGKHFLISYSDFSLRVHFMLFGSYRINERKEAPVRLSLGFDTGELNFYACSLKFIEGNLDDQYDWKADVMADEWDPGLAERRLKALPDASVCDVLLDQNIFSGVGNIIKNEVLYRIAVHPRNRVGDLPVEKLRALIQEARNYSFDFLRWKKEYALKKHWLVHTKKTCALGHPVHKAYLGKTNRRTFYCDLCQVVYDAPFASSHS